MHEVLWFLLIDLTACLLIALILTALTGSRPQAPKHEAVRRSVTTR